MNARHRIIAAVAALALTVSGASGCSEYQKLRKGVDQLSHPDTGPRPLTDEQKIKLIDSMRGKGSFEAARDRLTVAPSRLPSRSPPQCPAKLDIRRRPQRARLVPKRVLCDDLDPDLAVAPEPEPLSSVRRSPRIDSLPPLGSSVRKPPNMAPRNRARCSMSRKRDYDVQGDGNEFNLGQVKIATCSSPAIASCFRKFSTHHRAASEQRSLRRE